MPRFVLDTEEVGLAAGAVRMLWLLPPVSRALAGWWGRMVGGWLTPSSTPAAEVIPQRQAGTALPQAPTQSPHAAHQGQTKFEV